MTTGSNLDKPLGQHRKGGASKRGGGSNSGPWLVAFAFVVLFAGAGYFALQQNTPPDPEPGAAADEPVQTATTPQPQAADDRAKRLSGRSGANIQRMLTDDGQTVMKITPLDRSGDGAVIISGASAVGQLPQVAHLPIPELPEDTEFGRLPIVVGDERRPMDAYARPWSGARGAHIAIFVGGLGISQTGTQNAIKTLPPEITLAFAATGNSLQRWLQEARRGGHEVLLPVPFEPFDYSNNDSGLHTLLVADGSQQNLDDLHWAMGRITNYTGIMNFTGARFLSDPAATEALMRELAKRGVLFLDNGSSARTVSGAIARAIGVPYAEGNMVVDDKVDRTEIMRRLDDVERVAKRDGTTIATASDFDTSIDAIAAWANEAKARVIEIVAVSALAQNPEKF